MIREIVQINEELCDGCGLCVPNCAEGALKIVNGKAKLSSEALCDGMGACLGHCPKGAITIERREADAFDEQTVEEQKKTAQVQREAAKLLQAQHHASGGCPGSRFMALQKAQAGQPSEQNPDRTAAVTDQVSSELTHWPVQLRLLSPAAPVLCQARLLVCADCVPVACADFHQTLLKGHAVVISCPKFDQREADIEKLAEIIRHNELQEITVARMEVPCCAGLVQAVLQARQTAGEDVSMKEVIISIQDGGQTERASR